METNYKIKKKIKALRVLYCFNEKWSTIMFFSSFNRKGNKLISNDHGLGATLARDHIDSQQKKERILARLIILKLTASLDQPSPREGSNPSARSYVIMFMAMRSHLKVDLINSISRLWIEYLLGLIQISTISVKKKKKVF